MINFNNSFEKMSQDFFRKVTPTVAQNPSLVKFNNDLSTFLGFDFKNSHTITEIFSGKSILEEGSYLAMAYAGHQFGHFVPSLGDGRALLLGEVISPVDDQRYDLHFKGSGVTPFSRRGDGRSALGPVIREYLVSEAMHALGVPTTRSLCAIRTGEVVYRDQELPGGILTRVAKSHLRVGTFEYFAARGDVNNLKLLADYAISRLYSEIMTQEEDRYFEFWKGVADKQIDLISSWLSLGFIHGVMNTDNMSISGETIDYGPCAFMEKFHPRQVFSSIDQNGRYSYSNQSNIMFWNLARLAETLIPLFSQKEKVIKKFEDEFLQLQNKFKKTYLKKMNQKLGLTEVLEGDDELIQAWLVYLEKNKLDFTWSFKELEFGISKEFEMSLPKSSEFEDFHDLWKKRLSLEAKADHEILKLMHKSNPYLIARNHLVEKAIEKVYQGDDSFFHAFHEMLKTPFHFESQREEYCRPLWSENSSYKTFCGT